VSRLPETTLLSLVEVTLAFALLEKCFGEPLFSASPFWPLSARRYASFACVFLLFFQSQAPRLSLPPLTYVISRLPARGGSSIPWRGFDLPPLCFWCFVFFPFPLLPLPSLTDYSPLNLIAV